MKISIVTISFNQATYLRQCIESVLSQDYSNFEYIVVDPGSTDESRDIIRSYGGRLTCVFEPDAGPADGLNHGFARATGEVFGFINADDFLLPGALRTMADHFTREGLDHFVSGCGYISCPGQPRRRIVPTRMSRLMYLYGAVTVFQPGTFFPRWLFEKVGGFNPTSRVAWDGELFLEFLCADARHKVISSDVAVFRVHSESITGSGRLDEIFRADRDRMFREKVGRARNTLDVMLSFILRAYKVFSRRLVLRKS